jgi:hypothetical protein
MLMPERRCETCKRQKEWGCDAEETGETDRRGPVWRNPAHLPLTIDGEDTYRCPRRPIKDDPRFWARLMEYYGHYKNGFLPGPGGLDQQSARGMALLSMMHSCVQECAKEQGENQAAEQRRRT